MGMGRRVARAAESVKHFSCAFSTSVRVAAFCRGRSGRRRSGLLARRQLSSLARTCEPPLPPPPPSPHTLPQRVTFESFLFFLSLGGFPVPSVVSLSLRADARFFPVAGTGGGADGGSPAGKGTNGHTRGKAILHLAQTATGQLLTSGGLHFPALVSRSPRRPVISAGQRFKTAL